MAVVVAMVTAFAVMACGCGKQEAVSAGGMGYTYADPVNEEDGTGTFVHDYSVTEVVVDDSSADEIDRITAEITDTWKSEAYASMTAEERTDALMSMLREKEAEGIIDEGSIRYDEAASFISFDVGGVAAGVTLD